MLVQTYTDSEECQINNDVPIFQQTSQLTQEELEIELELVENFVDNLGPPLYMIPPSQNVYNAPISQHHHYMAMCAFASYHNLSDRGFRHLIKLMGLHLPEQNLMETNIDTLKRICGFDSNFLEHHLYCSICKKLFTGDVENCKTPGCTGRKEKNSTNYFVTGSMEVQLKDILEREGIWTAIQEYAGQRCQQRTTMSDIVDGMEYKKLKKPGEFLSDGNNLTLVFVN